MKFQVKKSGSTTEKTLKGLKDLASSELSVGHFSDQGLHPYAVDHEGQRMSYVDLMEIHHKGSESFPPRPVLDVMVTLRAPNLNNPEFSSAISDWMKTVPNKVSNKRLLTKFGEGLVEVEKGIFGDTSVLIETSNPTPLVKTSALKGAVTFKIKG